MPINRILLMFGVPCFHWSRRRSRSRKRSRKQYTHRPCRPRFTADNAREAKSLRESRSNVVPIRKKRRAMSVKRTCLRYAADFLLFSAPSWETRKAERAVLVRFIFLHRPRAGEEKALLRKMRVNGKRRTHRGLSASGKHNVLVYETGKSACASRNT